jgi:triosephosphate isomerase
MQKGDDSVKVTTMEYADYAQKGYTFIRQDRQLIVEGYKSPIHDFAIYNLLTGEDLKEQVLQSKNYQIVFVMPFLSETDEDPIEELKKIYEWTKNRNIDFYALSSASLEPVKEFKKKHNLSFDIHAADQKMLMTMARYNPTFYLFKGSTVLDKFSGFNMPTISRLEEITGI